MRDTMAPEASRPAESHPTPQEWVHAAFDLRNRLTKQRRRVFESGKVRRCPSCGKRALEGRDDLARETIVGSMAIVHHNLHGARCRHCRAEFLESYEEIALEEAGKAREIPDYEARVTSVSGRNLGTYWPRDVVRVMQLHKEDMLHVQVLDRDTMILHRRHRHP